MVAARCGDLDRALEHFRETATTDLLDTTHAVVGGTFIGGIHTAACGGTYQLAVQGFGGLGSSSGRLTIDPALPAEWEAMTYPIRWRGLRLQVTVWADRVEVAGDANNDRSAALSVGGAATEVAPGAVVVVR